MHNVQKLSHTQLSHTMSHSTLSQTVVSWVIHKVHMLERGRGGPAKSIMARMGEGEGSAVSVHTPRSFFAGSLQNKSKSIVQKKK